MDFGQSSSLSSPLQREWLITNGLGGYAMGAGDGTCAQTHHALLVIPVRPPLQRVMYIRQLDEALFIDGSWVPLRSSDTKNEAFSSPYRPTLTFSFHHGTPRFDLSLAGRLLTKRLLMPEKGHGVCVRYDWSGEHAARLRIVPCVMFRDLETCARLAETYLVRAQPHGILIYSDPNDKPCSIVANRPGMLYPVNSWKPLRMFDRATNSWQEEDVYLPSAFELDLEPGESVTLLLQIEGLMRWSNGHGTTNAEAMFASEVERRQIWSQELSQFFPDRSIQPLARSAQQFLIERSTAMTQAGRTILAGYPRLSDWGRDAMIALPGLLLTTKRFDWAKQVFTLLIKHANHGVIPNYFSCRPESPNYESLDATLWMFVAIYEYWQASKDTAYIDESYPILLEMLHSYMRGTAQGVKLDAEDGLLFSLEQHRPMTWMNAAVDDWLATPRPGKAIEVQALWYNALRIMAELAKILGKEEAYNRCSELAGHAGANLQKKFWCAETGYIFDCLVDISLTTTGRPSSGKSTSVGDSTLRPNQVIAVGLPFNAFSEAQTRAVVEVATQKLVTPYGLRTLSPDHPAYCGQYTGSPKRLASARHNGCVYPWLIWPFVRAHTRVYKNPQAMQELFAPLFSANESPCIDHIAEMYDGDAPHHPRGVPAYAASTGAILQSWQFLKQFS